MIKNKKYCFSFSGDRIFLPGTKTIEGTLKSAFDIAEGRYFKDGELRVMMNLKTILFKLKLRKLRHGDVVLVKEEGKLKGFRVIGNQFNIKIDEYNKQEAKTRGRVAVLTLYNGIKITPDRLKDFYINNSYLGYNFRVLRTKDVTEVF
jgi:hypothetical protein